MVEGPLGPLTLPVPRKEHIADSSRCYEIRRYNACCVHALTSTQPMDAPGTLSKVEGVAKDLMSQHTKLSNSLEDVMALLRL